MTERAGAADLPTILVADDEQPLRELLAGVLSRKFRVLQAQNGVEALALFQQHRDDVVLVISDVTMPQMNGIELAERLLADKPALKFVFYSAYYEDDERMRRLADQGAVFLAKPFSLPAFVARIERIIGR